MERGDRPVSGAAQPTVVIKIEGAKEFSAALNTFRNEVAKTTAQALAKAAREAAQAMQNFGATYGASGPFDGYLPCGCVYVQDEIRACEKHADAVVRTVATSHRRTRTPKTEEPVSRRAISLTGVPRGRTGV